MGVMSVFGESCCAESVAVVFALRASAMLSVRLDIFAVLCAVEMWDVVSFAALIVSERLIRRAE